MGVAPSNGYRRDAHFSKMLAMAPYSGAPWWEIAPDNGCYPPANFFFATGRAKAFVGPWPLFAITLL